MRMALVKKEISELFYPGLIALAVLLFQVGLLTHWSFLTRVPLFSLFKIHLGELASVPFQDGRMHTGLALVGGALLACMAFWQTLAAERQGTFPFLLHLPLSRVELFLTKMIAAMVVYFFVLLAPVLVYGWWASVPGHHPSPFDWSMLDRPFWLIFSLPILYFTWMIIYLLQGINFGMRLLPLITATFLMFVCFDFSLWWLWRFLLIVLAEAGLILVICNLAEERDF